MLTVDCYLLCAGGQATILGSGCWAECSQNVHFLEEPSNLKVPELVAEVGALQNPLHLLATAKLCTANTPQAARTKLRN